MLKILDLEFDIHNVYSNKASGSQAASSGGKVYGPSPPPETLPEVQGSEIFLMLDAQGLAGYEICNVLKNMLPDDIQTLVKAKSEGLMTYEGFRSALGLEDDSKETPAAETAATTTASASASAPASTSQPN